ncbi:TPA: CooT family nickel-binding protein [Candidatus Bathyarchaeota archaeon]|nr:CooT family nickel-binding protein [Candidatus Bathyarchaeota archaeon]
MCLLKVYVEEDAGRRLVARDIVFISKEGESIKLKGIEFEEKTLMNVDVFSIDALNSVLILKKRNES